MMMHYCVPHQVRSLLHAACSALHTYVLLHPTEQTAGYHKTCEADAGSSCNCQVVARLSSRQAATG
jgi:hypothetical protein